MINTYLTKEEFKKDYKNIKELRESENTLVRMPRSLYQELDDEFNKEIGASDVDTPVYREDIDDTTAVIRCINCGSEVVIENVVGQSLGFYGDDNIFHSMTAEDNIYSDGYECQGCGIIL